MPALPEYLTPAELAEHLGVSERALRERARKIGACREFGKRLIMLQCDVDALLEDMRPCPSESTSAAKSGTIAARLPVSGYTEAAARLTKGSRKGSPPKGKRSNGVVTSMDRNRS